jgi:predicted RNA binding protein YcfA (HicA-like mRNA interferase family)
MNKTQKLYQSASRSPNSLLFRDLCKLAEAVGFTFRDQSGSHKIYKHPTLRAMMNFQPDKHDKKKAKTYQVTQLLDFINQHNLIPKAED